MYDQIKHLFQTSRFTVRVNIYPLKYIKKLFKIMLAEILMLNQSNCRRSVQRTTQIII